MPSSQHFDFSFGIELELLLKPRKETLSKWLAAAKKDPVLKHHITHDWDWNLWPKDILPLNSPEHEEEFDRVWAKLDKQRELMYTIVEAILHKAGVPVTNWGNPPVKGFNGWHVMPEALYETYNLRQLKGEYFGCEIITRTMNTKGDGWLKEVNKAFKAIEEYFHIGVTKECAMHLHITPLTDKKKYKDKYFYDENALHRIGFGVIFWEHEFSRILPPERKMTPFAYPNFMVDWCRELYVQIVNEQGGKKWEDVWNKILEKSQEQKMDVILAHLRGLTLQQQVIRQRHEDMDQARYQSTNFSNVMRECGTIEYRRLPAVASAKDTIKWAACILALHCDMLHVFDFQHVFPHAGPPSRNDFLDALHNGFQHLDPSCSKWMQHSVDHEYLPIDVKAMEWPALPSTQEQAYYEMAMVMNKQLATISSDHDISYYVNSASPSSSESGSRSNSPARSQDSAASRGSAHSIRTRLMRLAKEDHATAATSDDRALQVVEGLARDHKNNAETRNAMSGVMFAIRNSWLFTSSGTRPTAKGHLLHQKRILNLNQQPRHSHNGH